MIESKISELNPFRILEEKDLLLKCEKNYDTDGALDLKKPYTSHRIEISSFLSAIFSRERTISVDWNFDKVPEQKIRYSINDFIDNVLLDKTNREDAINLNGGFYDSLSKDFKEEIDALDASEYSIANIDYVNRVAALVYAALLNLVTTYANIEICQSSIGDVIHSTTLSIAKSYTDGDGNRIEESSRNRGDAIVRNTFGAGRTIFEFGDFILKEPDTQWILSAQNRIIAGTDASSDIGKENGHISIQVDNVLNHSHSIGNNPQAHSHNTGEVKASVSKNGMIKFNCGFPDVDTGGSGSPKGSKGYNADLGIPSGAGKSSGSSSDRSKTQTSKNPIKSNKDKTPNGSNSGSINIEQAYKDVFVWVRIA